MWAVQTKPSSPFSKEEVVALSDEGIPYRPFTYIPLTPGREGFDPFSAIAEAKVLRCSVEAIDRLEQAGLHPPGLFFNLEHFNLTYWNSILDGEMLNPASTIVSWDDLIEFNHRITGQQFVRPFYDLKSFPGGLFDFSAYTPEDIFSRLERQGNRLKLDDLIAISPPREINAEYRFVIMRGQIVSHFQYRDWGRSVLLPRAIGPAVDYARGVLPGLGELGNLPGMVMDVAATSAGFKVLEFNCWNCSGIAFELNRVFREMDIVVGMTNV